MQIQKDFSFEAAHYLPDYHGRCERLHGHSYRLRVVLSGSPDSSGMVLDFLKVKEIVKNRVLDQLDHTLLNDLIPNPTAELICWWVWHALESDLTLESVTIWETTTSAAKLDQAAVRAARSGSAVPTGWQITPEIQAKRKQGWGCTRCWSQDSVQVLDSDEAN